MKMLDRVENQVMRQARESLPVLAKAAESTMLDDSTKDWAQQMHSLLTEMQTKAKSNERAARLMMLYLLCSEEM